MDKQNRRISGAMAFILLMGVVSLFSDMTHEGARSVLGEYLHLAGASGAAIGFVSGIGELLGYSLRLLSGFLADKTKKYWTLVIVGYGLQMAAIPALALIPQNGWIWACLLVTLERVGKAVKKPAKNTLVSFAAGEIGTGKGFAYQEFVDQLGAFLGPVLLWLVAAIHGTEDLFSTYRIGFAVLGVPALITVALVLFSKVRYPHPEQFETEREARGPFRIRLSFVFFMFAIAAFAFGFADFTLITLHAANTQAVPESALPLLYAGAMVTDAFSALFFGWLFDRVGMKALAVSTAVCAGFSCCIFLSGDPALIVIGVVLWGVGMGAQESILNAAVSKLVPKSVRSTGFGVFETVFGVAWFLGSWLLGALYDRSLPALVAVSTCAEALSILFFVLCVQRQKKEV